MKMVSPDGEYSEDNGIGFMESSKISVTHDTLSFGLKPFDGVYYTTLEMYQSGEKFNVTSTNQINVATVVLTE